MSSVSWGTGRVDMGSIEGEPVVRHFENDGIVWYDECAGIALPGWQAALEPYVGPGYEGAPFRPPLTALIKTL